MIADDVEYYKQIRNYNKQSEMPLKFNTKVHFGCPYDCSLCTDHRAAFLPFDCRSYEMDVILPAQLIASILPQITADTELWKKSTECLIPL